MKKVVIFICGLPNTCPVKLLESFMGTQEAIPLAHCGAMVAMVPMPLLQDNIILDETSTKKMVLFHPFEVQG